MPNRPSVVIVAASARALAASARRAGYLPLVADCCGDVDTQACAEQFVQLPEHGNNFDRPPFTSHDLLMALAGLALHELPIGLVYGPGFEAQPELLDVLAARFPLLGNDAKTVGLLKDPLCFAKLCAICRVQHPEISLDRPRARGDWLCKRRGGSGGTHVRPLAECMNASPLLYFQRRVVGKPISVLFVAAGSRFEIIGFSVQWQAPCPQHPYRFGGAAKPAGLRRSQERMLEDVIQRLLQHLPLRGLNSADFLVTDQEHTLLEINPRPGATLDIFEPESNLFDRHVAACLGILSGLASHAGGARAAAIVYATQEIRALTFRAWPDWTADQQRFGSRVAAGAPLCTVVAAADSSAAARRRVEERTAEILRRAQGDTA